MAEKKLGTFDADAFYEALDSTRQARKKNWKEVAAASGVSASTLTRMAQGKRPDVDSLAALSAWSGVNTNDFVRSTHRKQSAEPLALISTHLRSDKNLSPTSAAALDQIIRAAYDQLRNQKK